MITDSARRATRGFLEPLARTLGRLGLTPNQLTVIGTLLHVIVAWLLATSHLFAGGIALAIAAGCDGLDGTLARLAGRAGRFGAFLDSTMDRISEILAFLGLLVYAQRNSLTIEVPLVLAALAGSLMVSYTRARSEGLDCGTKAGVFGRLERMVVVVVGLLTGLITPALWVVAIGAWLTVGQRIWDVYGRCENGALSGEPDLAGGGSTGLEHRSRDRYAGDDTTSEDIPPDL